ncbi:Ig-like domain-containing protein [Streptomyces sp. RB6PN25]|uniref:Ig-like domain-containing protein n=1 Tax=Streptomyces humicola TaxID=2953240 RepID=A0ABT1PWY6_9ACTN|nr:Ig-like domain-containing protein [Streptomyces humicola]MCQ4082203.1 Ig-like domain-containing protein [Streptomyces humicola]
MSEKRVTGISVGISAVRRDSRRGGHGRRGRRGKHATAAALSAVLGGALLLTACGGSGARVSSSASAASAADTAAAKDASGARITIAPKDKQTNVGINNDAKVSVAGGRLTKVVLTTADGGRQIPGAISADGRSWKPDTQLDRGTAYRITADAKDSAGRPATSNATFTTVSPANSFIAYYTPDAGSTVGVGMPVSVNFDKAISDKAAVQSHIQVSTSSGQKVVGHWFGDNRLDFRPENYWRPGSQVTLRLNLDNVRGANGITGVQDKTVTFAVGRSQVSTVDVATQTMTVTRDGKVIRTIPVSTGSPQHTTYNGQMVISEKFEKTRMDGSTVGFTNADGKGEYDIKDVPHAMRLSTSGTFIHGNYWSPTSVFGHVATSHGCIGMSDVKGGGDTATDAAWFYNNSQIGDVVVVKNSNDRTIAPDNGLNGWNMSWNQWVAGSAIPI